MSIKGIVVPEKVLVGKISSVIQVLVPIDKTLTKEDHAADAKAVGAAINNLSSGATDEFTRVYSQISSKADSSTVNSLASRVSSAEAAIRTDAEQLTSLKEELNAGYIGKASGDSAFIDDAFPAEHDLGVTVASKNLLDLSSIIGKTVTSNGGTLTVGADGGVTGSGTPTGSVVVSFNTNLPKKKVCLSVSGTFANIQCSIILRDSNDTNLNSFYVLNGKETVSFDISEYPTYSYARIEFKRVSNNAEMSGTAYFQIEAGNTATKYTPFVNVEGVKVTRTGKNLLLYPYADTTKIVNGITFTDNGDGTITANGTATANALFALANYNIRCQSGMFMSGCPSDGGEGKYLMYTNYYDAEKNRIGTYERRDNGSGVSIIDYNLGIDAYLHPYIKIFKGATVNNIVFKPMLEISDTATEYEQYNGQTATAAADGNVTGLKSIAPCMTLFSDTEGVTVNVEYYKDYYKSIVQSELNAKAYADKLFNSIVNGDEVSY